LSSSVKPSGLIKCNWQPVLAHRRMMLPVLGGISGLIKNDIEHEKIPVKLVSADENS